ncbi:MAG TPA: carbohydrate kinase family protein, partial [Clostridia bacterium]|nr:carbohydrate kinase family protein [Clostridia bacterium]
MDVVGIDTPCVDLLANIPKIPEANKGTRIQDYSWQGGGKVSSAMVASARLGARCGMIGVVDGDAYGKFCLDDFKDHGIDVSRMIVDKDGETPFSIVLADDHTHGRSIIYYPGTNRPLEVSDLDKDYIQSARYLHLAHDTPVTKQAAVWAREKGTRVVYDADGYRKGIEDMIPLIDVFIASEFFYEAMFKDGDYEANCRKVQDMGPDIVVFTLGEKGCVGVEGSEFFMEEGFSVEVMDTTGAGDVYHGAFIAGLLQGWDARQTARFSNAV